MEFGATVAGAATGVLLKELLRSLTDVQSSFVFRDKFNRVKEKLQWINSLLADAQQLKEEQRNHMTLKTLITQLRELVYDVDDLILDFHIRAGYEAVFPSRRNSPYGLYFHFHAERRLKEIIKRIADMEETLKAYWRPMNHHNQEEEHTTSMSIPPAENSNYAVGLEDDAQKIVKWITTDEQSCRIALVGMGGSGKTTLAQKIYNETDVNRFEQRIWVNFSDVRREEDILLKMWESIEEQDSSKLNASPKQRNRLRDRLRNRLRKFFHIFRNKPKKEKRNTRIVDDVMSEIWRSLINQRYLIVMDDVWSMNYRWLMRLIDSLPEGERCKRSIIITTRHEKIARDMGVRQIHKMQKLDENDSWNLFCSVAFLRNRSMSSDPEYEKVGKNIVKKCDGLPLAIKTIAGLLSTKLHSLSAWRTVCDNFFSEMGNENTVRATLRFSYDDLSPVLKHCILCFSAYPEHTEINADQLVYWWVSEGFVQGKEAIDTAFQCLQELISRCLVEAVEQRGFDGRVYKCKMHDMVRDLIITIAKDEKFCSFDEANKQVADVDSRHLGYSNGMELGGLKKNSKLRSFLLMKEALFISLHPALETVNSLRVVDLSNGKRQGVNVEKMWRWIKSQRRLAYINLEGVDNLYKLPDWIEKRQNIKILVMKECKNLIKLPSSIIYLQNLILLDVENCPLERLPRGFGKLTNLQVLYGLKLTKQGSGCTSLGELKGLINLRVLRIHLSKSNEIPADEEDILSNLPQLKVLYIDSKYCEQDDVELIDKLKPPASLEELHLNFYNGYTLPKWLSSSSLPELVYLSVDNSHIASVSPNFWNTDRHPWSLEGICLNNLPRFKLEWGDLRSMKYLRYVEVHSCKSLRTFPFLVKNSGRWEEPQ